MKIHVLDWCNNLDMIYDFDCIKAEVDGSVNQNPGSLGVVGIYDPNLQKYIAYKYKGQRITNQLVEMIAIYEGLKYCSEYDKCMITSDSLTTINMLSGKSNIRNPRLLYIKQLIDDEFFDKELYLVYRKGHTEFDLIGNHITKIVKGYNKTNKEPNISTGSLQHIINNLRW